jgi:hypothetical protein
MESGEGDTQWIAMGVLLILGLYQLGQIVGIVLSAIVDLL